MAKGTSTVNAEPFTPLRRSPRFLNTLEPISYLEISPEHSPSPKRVVLVQALRAQVSEKSCQKSRNWGNLGTGSAKSPGLSNGFEGLENLRRSTRLVGRQKAKNRAKTTGKDGSSSQRFSSSRRAVPVQETPKSRAVEASGKSRNCGDDKVKGCRELRQSTRVSKQQKPNRQVKKADEEKTPEKCMSNRVLSDIGNIINCVSGKSPRKKVLTDARKVGVDRNLCERAKGMDLTVFSGAVNSELVEDGKVTEEKGRKDNRVTRKRKRNEECKGLFKGWTDEQEKALQRAYFASQPTPHFWKKVAKRVPGKSAQECFDKIHSNDLTPPQLPPRSRAKKSASPMDSSSLSASKLLLSTKLNGKRPISNRRKCHVAQKTVRHMLQKHCHVEEDCEADIFSVLEPNTDPSAPITLPSIILSTPEHLQKKQGFLHKCFEKSSSGQKKPISRFSSSSQNVLISPPVLKQVKNRALHEKYIDQLHCREAKRKALSAREQKFITRKEEPEECHVQKVDVVRAAKVALVCEARDAISQLQRLQAKVTSNSCDFDDDEDASNDDDDEGEDEP